MTPAVDIAVVGAGPAACALASALRRRGRDAVLVAPNPDACWPNRYAVWADEIELPGTRFPQLRVDVGDPFELDRTYVVVDRPALRASFGELPAVDARALEVRADRVVTDAGEVRARVVVDASGAATRFLRRSGAATHFQTAFGAVVRPATPVPPTWMDFGRASGPRPSFLYAFPRPDGEAFVEETSLASPGGVSLTELEARLRRRVGAVELGEVERCVIPLDLPVPALDQPVLGFGAAASLVHPATGFQLARALRLAPLVADAVDAGWAGDPVRDGWAAIWPVDALRRHRLHTFGMRALASLDADGTRAFLRRFFALGTETWSAWLSDRLPTASLMWAMTRFYAGLSPGLAARIPLAGLGFGAVA